MDPSGAVFTYDNVVQEDAPSDAEGEFFVDDEEGEFFEDEITFDQEDTPEDNGNDGIMVEEREDTLRPVPPPVNPDRKQHNAIIYCCMVAFIIILAVLAVVLTLDLEEIEQKGTSLSQKEKLINLLTSRGIAYEDLLRSFGTPQGQALAFMSEEDWDGNMSWLYSEIENEPTRIHQRIIERYILALIYFECEGNDWFHGYDFLTPQDHCDWNAVFPSDGEATIEGVTACNDEGYVQRLYFPINNLRCQDGLPDEMEHLKLLEALVVRGNEIEGMFPFFIRELPQLSVLSFGYNRMDGSLPTWLGELTKISVLHLSDNTFVGTLPESMKKLSNLKYLGMDDNYLSGRLDGVIEGLTKLEWLYMEDNQFTGTLEWVDQLSSLSYLDVSNNNLDGELPSNLLDHPKLTIMDLHGNKFSGKIPTVSKQNPELQLLSLHSNQLTGTIPEELSNLVNITMLDLSFNSFTGFIPALLSTHRLRFLMTSGNKFDQQEMPVFAELTSLVELSMKGNNLIGNIPSWIGDLTQMKWLDLDANLFAGSIPTEFGKMTDLYALMLNRNDLDGSLPTELAQLGQLEVLLIDGNAIIGDTSELCNRQDKIDFFISDCESGNEGQPPQIDCPCCSTCCVSGDKSCSNLEWTSVHDPIVENDFSRGYAFNYSDASPLFSKAYDVNP